MVTSRGGTRSWHASFGARGCSLPFLASCNSQSPAAPAGFEGRDCTVTQRYSWSCAALCGSVGVCYGV